MRSPPPPAQAPLILVNTELVPGHRVRQVLGLVQGNTVRAKHVGRDIAASFKNVVGGELRGYTELLQESRHEAVGRMMDQARSLGGNAVINVRFSTSAVTGGAAELYAYGTAVIIEPESSQAPAPVPHAQVVEHMAPIGDADEQGQA